MKTFFLGSSKSQVLEMIPEKAIHKIRLNDKEVALVRIAEDFFCFQAHCPHRGANLLEGVLVDNEVICPLHEYRFDIKTGEVKIGSCGDLEIYNTKLTDEGLKISLP